MAIRAIFARPSPTPMFIPLGPMASRAVPMLRDQAEGCNPKMQKPGLKPGENTKLCGPQAPSPATCYLLQGSHACNTRVAHHTTGSPANALFAFVGVERPSAVAFSNKSRYQTLQTKDESTLALFLAAITKKSANPLLDFVPCARYFDCFFLTVIPPKRNLNGSWR